MLNRLLVEHDHLLRKLNLLELQYLDMCRGKTPDYALMRSIVLYVQEYPEQIHHPLEDMIYSILLERVDDIEYVQELMTEHTKLEADTRKLRESLESLASGSVTKEELEQQLSAFLVEQREHIYSEEVKVYPLVQSVLTKEDWKQLQSMIPLLDEPLSGMPTRDDYEQLYHEIEDKSKAELLEREKGEIKYIDSERRRLAENRPSCLV